MTRRGAISLKVGLGLAGLLVLSACENASYGMSYGTGLYYEDDLYWNDWYHGGGNTIIIDPDNPNCRNRPNCGNRPDRLDRPDRPTTRPTPPIAQVPSVRPPIHTPSGGFGGGGGFAGGHGGGGFRR